MKAIVAPIDCSLSSDNSVYYAADLAAMTGCSLSILHICPITIAASGGALKMKRVERITAARKHLDNLKDKITEKFDGQVLVELKIRVGAVNNEIEKFCSSKDTWLIVISGENKNRSERFFSKEHAVYAYEKFSWPVIVVPPDVHFKTIKKIGLACDHDDVQNTITLKKLESYLNWFKADLFIIYVNTKPSQKLTEEVSVESRTLHEMIVALDPRFVVITDVNVEEAIDSFAKNKLNLLIIIPKKHGFFHRMFFEKLNKNLLRKPRVPLMSTRSH